MKTIPSSNDFLAMTTDVPAIPAKWKWHYKTLAALQRVLASEREEHDAASRATHEHGGADLVDVATDEVEHRELLAELQHEDSALLEVSAALQRILNGTYGVCEVTGAPIAAARLRAVPWTRFSRSAAARLEKAGRS